MEKKLTYNEWLKLHEEKNRKWKFDLFAIRCKKCSSENVEFNSDMEMEHGYYNNVSIEGKIIVKCHGCGNAFTLNWYDIEKD
ncbi:MAG: hypothetical protein ACFFG0_02805 [Candidatus Thorarchaeota archaeon]